VPGYHSHETIRALEQLLERARRGEVIGVAYAAMYRRRRYIISCAGEADRNHTFTIGMLQVFSSKLSQKVIRRR
jgi:hypothetical protein